VLGAAGGGPTLPYRILTPIGASADRTNACALAVMLKIPRVGLVKTRLTPPLTEHEAAALSSCFLRDTASNIAAVASDAASPLDGVVVYTPVGAESELAGLLPQEFVLLAQRGASFGHRLSNAAHDLLTLGYRGLCLINADSPTLPPELLRSAAVALSRPGDRVVLGPSKDGGYYLIGLKQAHHRLFEEIEWSTSRVFAQTLDRAFEVGVEVELLPAWYDVDSRAELSSLCEELFASNGNLIGESAVAYPAPHTRAYLARLIQAEGCERIWPAGVSLRMELKP
jgi:uncharacterized protein